MAQVQGEELYLSHSGQEVDDNIDEVVAARGDSASLSARLAEQDTEIGTVAVAEQQDRAALITQVDGGAKNLIDPSAFTSQTKNGVTVTKNPDDSYTITGTFTARVTSFFVIDNIVGTAGTVLAFEGGEAGIYAYARNGNPAAWLTSSGGVPVTTGVPIPEQDVGESFDIAIMVNNSDGRFDDRVFDKTVRVMICTAADYAVSPAFVPYAPTNRELYEMILALQSGRSVQSSASLMQAGRIDAELTDAGTGEEEEER